MRKITSLILALFMLFGGTLGLVSTSKKASAEDENRYLVPGGSLIGVVNESIYYYDKKVTQYVNAYNMPGYEGPYTCGVVAGVNVVAWYDRIYPNLIPNFEPGSMVLGKWKWATHNATIDNLFSTINTLTNGDNGVTVQSYLNGLNTYVSGRGLTFTSSSVTLSNYKTQLSSGKLLTIFINGFNISFGPTEKSGYDQLTLEQYAGRHVMTVYGWCDINYYSAPNVISRTDSYLYVGTSFGTPSNAMLMISRYCTVESIYTTCVS